MMNIQWIILRYYSQAKFIKCNYLIHEILILFANTEKVFTVKKLHMYVDSFVVVLFHSEFHNSIHSQHNSIAITVSKSIFILHTDHLKDYIIFCMGRSKGLNVQL